MNTAPQDAKPTHVIGEAVESANIAHICVSKSKTVGCNCNHFQSLETMLNIRTAPRLNRSARPDFLALGILLISMYVTPAIAGGADARRSYDAKNYALALREARASQDDAISQNVLGLLYDTGSGVQKNIKVAIDWYEKSANQGYPPALSNLGVILIEGDAVPKDVKRGLQMLEQAAGMGYTNAKYNLGVIYYSQKYGLRSLAQAEKYLQAAAAEGDGKSSLVLGDIYHRLHQSAKEAGLQNFSEEDAAFVAARPGAFRGLAAQRYRAAIEAGDTTSIDRYVVLTEGDKTADRLQFLRRLAQDGYAAAVNAMLSVIENSAEKLAFLRDAADKGSPYAKAMLATYYFHGTAVQKAIPEAGRLLEAASVAAAMKGPALTGENFVEVAAGIGDKYVSGNGLPMDLQEGARWWRMAMNLGGPGYTNEPLKVKLAGLDAKLQQHDDERKRAEGIAEYQRQNAVPFDRVTVARPHAWSGLRNVMPSLFWHAMVGDKPTNFDQNFDGIFTVSDGIAVTIRCLDQGLPGISIKIFGENIRFWPSAGDQPFVTYELYGKRTAAGTRGPLIQWGYTDPKMTDNYGNVFSVLVTNAGTLKKYQSSRDALSEILGKTGAFDFVNNARKSFSPDPALYSPSIDLDNFKQAGFLVLSIPRVGDKPLKKTVVGGVSTAFSYFCSAAATKMEVREAAIQEDEVNRLAVPDPLGQEKKPTTKKKL